MASRHTFAVAFLAVVALGDGVCAGGYNWKECKETVRKIRDENMTLGAINRDSLDRYLYNGPIRGLTNPAVLDDPDYIRVTYDGCLAICGDPVTTYSAPDAMGYVANWIFPLAILLNLPFESLHEHKI